MKKQSLSAIQFASIGVTDVLYIAVCLLRSASRQVVLQAWIPASIRRSIVNGSTQKWIAEVDRSYTERPFLMHAVGELAGCWSRITVDSVGILESFSSVDFFFL